MATTNVIPMSNWQIEAIRKTHVDELMKRHKEETGKKGTLQDPVFGHPEPDLENPGTRKFVETPPEHASVVRLIVE